MVYESGFTTRRTYSSRPVVSSYSVSTPRYDLVRAAPGTHRSRGSSDYSYSYKSSVEKSNYDSSNPYSRPERYESSYETTSRSGPGGYNYSTERSSTLGGGPGGYSYSSTTSGVLPGGSRYRHFSYRV
ncbi:protein anoxia up-regulated-like isoform X5 [Musca autumnalis]|uniref:protein anoxia up-regulated-like isoform X5 n=1 Tax=Musca autumnalis TaxID=221902 RepID=UPI003CE7A6E3